MDLSRLLAVGPAEARAHVPEFADVFRQHFDFVWRTLRSLGVPESGVDDAVQDVFISVHRRLPEFEGRSALKTWIYSIAYHTAQNHRRSARRRETLPLEPDLVSGAPGPGELAAGAQAGRFVLRFLDQLAPERRDVFVLCVLEELSARGDNVRLSAPHGAEHAELTEAGESPVARPPSRRRARTASNGAPTRSRRARTAR